MTSLQHIRIGFLTIIFLYFSAANANSVCRILPATERSRGQRISKLRKFMNAAVSGAVSCSVTHSVVCPLDVIKTRIQTDAAMTGKSMGEAFQIIVKSGGKGVLLQGLAATFSGYAIQGFCKFGFYDLIKDRAYRIIKDEATIERVRLPILLISSGLAEIIASWALCPLEVTRIFMVMNPQMKSGMISAMKSIVARDGPSGLFKGLPMIMLRQVPYTCAKLAGYEIISDTLTKALKKFRDANQQGVHIPIISKTNLVNGKEVKIKNNIWIQLSSGIMAGFLAATISHPADVLLSRVCRGSDPTDCFILNSPMALIERFQELGFRNCYAGLQPRALMIGSLTAMQFVIYEQTKNRVEKFKMPDRGIE
jgi:solute carrier family 25 (mitochondrial phosphate transporter), member 3